MTVDASEQYERTNKQASKQCPCQIQPQTDYKAGETGKESYSLLNVKQGCVASTSTVQSVCSTPMPRQLQQTNAETQISPSIRRDDANFLLVLVEKTVN